MPTSRLDAALTLAERRAGIAAILAKGVVRWRRRAQSARHPAESPPISETRLELSGETRLSVRTRGFTPRGDGDDV